MKEERNSLKELISEVVKHWHPEKNGNKTPDDFFTKKDKIWLRCSNNNKHVIETNLKSIENKISANRIEDVFLCNECYLLLNKQSFGHKNPEVVEFWHPVKNGDMTPYNVSYGSTKEVWFKCKDGPDHEWSVIIKSYSKKKYARADDCPFCRSARYSVTNNIFNVENSVFDFIDEDNLHIMLDKPFNINGRNRIWLKCKKCGVKTNAEARDLFSRNKTSSNPEAYVCRHCNNTGYIKNRLLEKYPEIEKYIIEGGNDLEVIKSLNYASNKKIITLECNNCKTHFKISPHLINKRLVYYYDIERLLKCNACLKKYNGTESSGEKDCRLIFEEMFKKEFKTARPDFLRNHKTGLCLELDGFNDELKIAFEFNGQQHYSPVDYFGGEERFLIVKQNDELKKKLCAKNNISLIVIPYTKKTFKEKFKYIKSQLKKYNVKFDGNNVILNG